MENRDRFWKLFRMLGSDNDAEALSALRSLQFALKAAGLNWTQWSQQLEDVDRKIAALQQSKSLDEFLNTVRREFKIK